MIIEFPQVRTARIAQAFEKNLADVSGGEARAGRPRPEPRGTPGKAVLVFSKSRSG